MTLGQKVTRTPLTFTDPAREKSEPKSQPMTGRVIYIHPQGRYHTVEFQMPLGVVRESFQGVPEE